MRFVQEKQGDKYLVQDTVDLSCKTMSLNEMMQSGDIIGVSDGEVILFEDVLECTEARKTLWEMTHALEPPKETYMELCGDGWTFNSSVVQSESKGLINWLKQSVALQNGTIEIPDYLSEFKLNSGASIQESISIRRWVGNGVNCEFPNGFFEVAVEGYQLSKSCGKALEYAEFATVRVAADLFRGCPLLEKVHIRFVRNRHTIRDSIENLAFGRCISLSDVTLEGYCHSIGFGAFSNCKALKHIELPDSVENLGRQVFMYSGLTRFVAPQELMKLGDSCFYQCEDLEYADFSNSKLYDIDADAFFGCEKLREVRLSDRLSMIGEQVFANCPSLKEIQLPDNMLFIGKGCFDKDITIHVRKGTKTEGVLRHYMQSEGHVFNIQEIS